MTKLKSMTTQPATVVPKEAKVNQEIENLCASATSCEEALSKTLSLISRSGYKITDRKINGRRGLSFTFKLINEAGEEIIAKGHFISAHP